MGEDIPLYDPDLLNKFDLGERFNTLKQDPTFKVRPLLASDYSRGFLNLLKELTEVGDITQDQFEGQLTFTEKTLQCSFRLILYLVDNFQISLL